MRVCMEQFAPPDPRKSMSGDEFLHFFDPESEHDIDMLAHTLSPTIAFLLLKHFPGVELRVPKKMRPDHPIAEAIGFEFACQLSDYTGLGKIGIPMRHPARGNAYVTRDRDFAARLEEMLQQGMKRVDIATRLGITPRHLRRITAKMGLSGVSNYSARRKALPAPPESKSNGGLTGGLVDFGLHAPPDTPNGAQWASESKYGFYTPQPRKDQQ